MPTPVVFDYDAIYHQMEEVGTSSWLPPKTGETEKKVTGSPYRCLMCRDLGHVKHLGSGLPNQPLYVQCDACHNPKDCKPPLS